MKEGEKEREIERKGDRRELTKRGCPNSCKCSVSLPTLIGTSYVKSLGFRVVLRLTSHVTNSWYKYELYLYPKTRC